MALTNPTKLINVQELQYFEGKLAAKYQTQAISVNGITATSVTGALSELKTEIVNQISAVYKPAGDIAAAGLVSSLLVAANLGKVYNLTDDATTTADWKEGQGYTVEAGTDVAIVAVESGGSTTYKFNAFGKKVDLSNYKTKQTAVSDPTADGTGITFIATASQNANGEITVTKKTVQSATPYVDAQNPGQAGLMSAADKAKLDGVDYSGKADKDTDAVENNIAIFDDGGNPVDSGHALSEYKTKQTAVADSDATTSGNGLTFVDSVTQDANGEITVHKKAVAEMGASGTNHAAGLVPDPGATAGTAKYLREDGTWQIPFAVAVDSDIDEIFPSA